MTLTKSSDDGGNKGSSCSVIIHDYLYIPSSCIYRIGCIVKREPVGSRSSISCDSCRSWCRTTCRTCRCNSNKCRSTTAIDGCDTSTYYCIIWWTRGYTSSTCRCRVPCESCCLIVSIYSMSNLDFYGTTSISRNAYIDSDRSSELEWCIRYSKEERSSWYLTRQESASDIDRIYTHTRCIKGGRKARRYVSSAWNCYRIATRAKYDRHLNRESCCCRYSSTFYKTHSWECSSWDRERGLIVIDRSMFGHDNCSCSDIACCISCWYKECIGTILCEIYKEWKICSYWCSTDGSAWSSTHRDRCCSSGCLTHDKICIGVERYSTRSW